MGPEIDLRVPPCAPATEVASFVRLCEEAGFDGVGILDAQLLERDVFVSMALALQATFRIRVASAVTNPVTRHLSVLASAAKTVAELAPSRVAFWIGRGFSSVQTIGFAPATVRELRQSVLTLKRLMVGERMAFYGATSRMRRRRGAPDWPSPQGGGAGAPAPGEGRRAGRPQSRRGRNGPVRNDQQEARELPARCVSKG
jgi:5,10-methylenetetrahydromethanopterin reductase